MKTPALRFQAAASLNDAELAFRAPALLAREAAARAAVAAIAVAPISSGFLGLARTSPAPLGELRVTAPHALFGRVQTAPVLAPHIHTPHCDPACAIRFAPHVHSTACNHERSPEGAVWAAAFRGDAPALEAALAAGGSTEEIDIVSDRAVQLPLHSSA